ncbi:MAG: hypothetical protein GC161_01280 [Planctomycetaceae bacterium]|nr:hypothetical protein [Planctomycetaceae bacterium]
MKRSFVCLWVLAVLLGPVPASSALCGASPSAVAPQDGGQAGPPAPRGGQGAAPSSKGLTKAERDRLRPRLRGHLDPERAAVGAAVLAQLERRLGSVAGVLGDEEAADALAYVVPLWDVVPGVQFEALFTQWVNVSLETKEREAQWRPHHRVPVFGRYLPNGDGYRVEEQVVSISKNPPRYAPAYIRVVRRGDRAWIEAGDTFGREPDSIQKVRTETLRDVGLLWFPLGLRALDATLAAMEPVEDPTQGESAEGERAALYELRYRESLRLLEYEWSQEFYLGLDRETGLPRQLRYHVTDGDRVNLRTPVQWVLVDFDVWQQIPIPEEIRAAWGQRVREQWQAANPGKEWDEGRLEVPRAVELPAGITIWRPEARQTFHIEVVRQDFGPLDPDSLRLPWQNENKLWRTSERASHWDPPPKPEPAPSTETPAGSAAGAVPAEKNTGASQGQ